MNVTVTNGIASFSIVALFEGIRDPEMKKDVARHLACDDDIIRWVTQQILDKWTEDGWSGAALCTAAPDTVTVCVPALDWAWRELAKRSGEVAKREIERLEAALKHEQKSHQDTRDRFDKTVRYW